jgi:hypothetical protein
VVACCDSDNVTSLAKKKKCRISRVAKELFPHKQELCTMELVSSVLVNW